MPAETLTEVFVTLEVVTPVTPGPTVMRPSEPPSRSANQRLPSDSAGMPHGSLPEVRADVDAVIALPAGTRLMPPRADQSVKHRLPSGPLAIEVGLPPPVRPVENSDAKPPVVIRPIE